MLEALGRLRNTADYQLSPSGPFVSEGLPFRPRPTPRQPLPCSTPSKPTQGDEQQPWDQSPREYSEPGVVTGTSIDPGELGDIGRTQPCPIRSFGGCQEQCH